MRYTLLMHYPEIDTQDLPAETMNEAMAEGQAQMSAYIDALEQAKVLISAEVLASAASTTTLTMSDGEVQIKDGPFADSKEQLGGTFVIDVANLDEAIAWARQAPPLKWGAVEVRAGAVHTVNGSWTPNA